MGLELVDRSSLYAQTTSMHSFTANEDIVFTLPFFIINCLKLRKRQKIALCGVFSLGLITIVISVARFIVYTVTDYNVDDASGSKQSYREEK